MRVQMSSGGVSPAVALLNKKVCDICRDPKYNNGNCLPGYCCAYGEISDMMGIESCTYASACCCVYMFCCAGTCDIRTRMELKLGMPRRSCNESCCVNYCNHLFCCCCLQLLELDAARVHAAWKNGTSSTGEKARLLTSMNR
jgi:hypothetical protein